MTDSTKPASAGLEDIAALQQGLINMRDEMKRGERERYAQKAKAKKAATVLLTVFAKQNGVLTKQISKDNSLKGFSKDASLCCMSSGTARREEIHSVQDLEALISSLSQNEALALGIFADNPKTAKIGARKNLKKGERARVKGGDKGLIFDAGRPALLLLDVDVDADVEGFDGTTEGVWRVLTAALPFFEGKAVLGRSSTSSEIYDGTRRLDNPKRAGQHFYLFVENGPDVPAILKAIDNALWLKGLGHIKISSSGARLYRTFVDTAVGSPERLIFEAPPVLNDGLTQGPRTPMCREGDKLRLSDIPELSVSEQVALAALKKAAFDAAEVEAVATRERWIETRVAKMVEYLIRTYGISHGEARLLAKNTLKACASGVLTGAHKISVEDPENPDAEVEVTVDELLDDPERFQGCYCRDPYEPERGPQKARIHLPEDGQLELYSWAHGGQKYKLRHSLQGALKRINGAPTPQALNYAAKDAARVDADAADARLLTDALVGKGMRRTDVRAIFRENKPSRVGEDHAEREVQRPTNTVAKDATHADIAMDLRRALSRGGIAPVYDQGGIYTYGQGVWTKIERSALSAWIGSNYRHCDRALRQSDYDGICKAFENLIEKTGFFDATAPGVAADAKFWTVNAKGELVSHPLEPSHGARFVLPYGPDVEAEEPKMLGDLFDMVFMPDHREGNALAVGALMGAAILGLGRQFKEAGFLIGAGDSGKSTIGAVLKQFLPPSAVAAVNLSRFSEDYALAELAGKRLNLPGEEPTDSVIPAAQLKQVTGGDPVNARFPYGRPFNFVPTALQLFTANRMPPLREHEQQIYRRMVFVHFARSVPAEKQIGKTEIAASRIVEAEGPKILGWAMKCAARAVVRGTMQTDATLEAIRVWRKEEDTVLSAFFGQDRCFEVTGDIGHTMSAKEVYRKYDEFTRDAGRRPLGRNMFYERLRTAPDLLEAGVKFVTDRKGSQLLQGVYDLRQQALEGLQRSLEAVSNPAKMHE